MENAASVGRKQLISAITASVFGWSLDLFDLFIILYVAPTIGPLFFPSSNPTLSLASVYASFAVSLLMRPAGSAVFGVIADKQGRKRAMIGAIIGVGLFTALLGTLPTVARVGLLAPVLFLLLRLLQGLFVGGVVASTHTIGTETVAPRWRGLLSGLIGGGGAGIGALIASLALYVVSSAFPGHAFAVWGWRVMFFTGILSAVFGLFLFNALEESPLWVAAKKKMPEPAKAPLRTVLSGSYLPVFLVNLMVVTGGGTQYYLTSGYLPTFLAVIDKVPKPQVGSIMVWGSAIVLVSSVLVGHLSELIGRRKALLLVGIVNVIFIPVVYLQLARAASPGQIVFYVLVLAFLGNAAYAPILIFLNERFPTAVRASGTGFSWNSGFAIGGMMPTFVTLASPALGMIPSRLVYFLVGAILIMLIGAVLSPETRGRFE